MRTTQNPMCRQGVEEGSLGSRLIVEAEGRKIGRENRDRKGKAAATESSYTGLCGVSSRLESNIEPYWTYRLDLVLKILQFQGESSWSILHILEGFETL